MIILNDPWMIWGFFLVCLLVYILIEATSKYFEQARREKNIKSIPKLKAKNVEGSEELNNTVEKMENIKKGYDDAGAGI